MGLLIIDGTETFEYLDSKPFQSKLKQEALRQLLELLRRNNKTTTYRRYPKFGFEIEANLLRFELLPDGSKHYSLESNTEHIKQLKGKSFEVVDEYGKWMIELTPLRPFEDFVYGGNALAYLRNMFEKCSQMLLPGTCFLSAPIAPMFATPAEASSDLDLPMYSKSPYSHSEYISDDLIQPHPKFLTMTQNTRLRRGEKQDIRAPLFSDKNTVLDRPIPFEKDPGFIRLDCFGAGAGLCSLQATFGAKNLDEARWLYDQFHIFTPIFVCSNHSDGSQCINTNPQRQAT